MRRAILLLLFVTSTSLVHAQTGNGSPSNQGPSSGAVVPQANVGSQTFSIEGDVLGYKALESDAETIACDLAGELAGGIVVTANGSGAAAQPCATSLSVSGSHILVTSSTDQSLANYQLWRLGILTIDTLQREANTVVPQRSTTPIPENYQGVETAITGTLAIIQTVAGFFSSNESVAGIQGTPQDQALVDAVTRHLRIMGVHVVVPYTYSPYALSGVDYANSPFLNKLQRLQQTRITLGNALSDKTQWDKNVKQIADDRTKLQATTNSQQINQITSEIDDLNRANALLSQKYLALQDVSNTQLASMIQSIDSFMAALIASNVSVMSPASGNPGSTSPNSPAPSNNAGAPPPGSPAGNINITNNGSNTTSNPTAPPIPPIVSILYGDGLARVLGATVTNPTPLPETTATWRVLSLKALEVGSTVVSRANLFGTKIFYGGGAVATYIIYDLNGNVYCSANVFDYGGRIKGKDFNDKFRAPDINPSQQLIFQRGRCTAGP